MNYVRAENEYRYTLSSQAAVNVTFTAVLPLATTVESVIVDGTPVEFNVTDDIQNVCVSIDPFVLQGNKSVVIKYKGGIGAMLNLQPVVVGRNDDGIRMERESYDAETGIYTLEVAGAKGLTYNLDILTLSDVKSVSGAQLVSKDGNVTTLSISFPEKSKEPFVDGLITIQL